MLIPAMVFSEESERKVIVNVLIGVRLPSNDQK